ncbi:Cytochrome B561-related protein [Artemisia annua]|uniref:Cytochrome B561-related protein n=1 Tax=Artemisia annua TaxID=35608 RepID=A0A2U1LJ96_ARTAN|nr:Cytochrome B561-related protein [Artemisia annua]
MANATTTTSSKPVTKFTVYQNPAVSAALTTNSLRPSKLTIFFILTLLSASSVSLISFILRENDIVDSSKLRYITQDVAYIFLKVVQAVMALVLIGSLFALLKAISLWRTKAVTPASTSNSPNDQLNLTNRQLGLLGLKPKFQQVEIKSAKEAPSAKANASPADKLIPLHQPFTGSGHTPHLNREKSITSSGNKMHSFSTPSKPPVSSSVYLVPSQSPNIKTPTGQEQYVSSPWRGSPSREISTEKQLETFLADFDEKFSMSAGKMATPPPTISGFGSPGTNTSGTTRSTPLRAVRMSPGSQKFSTPPKKGEGDLPPPMTMEDSIAAFERLGVYPQIEQWRDHLRQWFSSVLLNPLLAKIETSHLKVMEAAAKLGISVTISKVGIDSTAEATANVTSNERNNDWQPAYTLDEEGLLLQLRTTLVQTLDSMSRPLLGGFQQIPTQNPSIPVVQECIDIITEHQKLLALVKGELAKGLLPHSSVRADYTVQRIRELAAGTCVKNFEYISNRDKLNKKWSELPTDSHLLLYLFCAFLEHPKWMLHVDPTSHTGVQSSKNPLFLGLLPPKERFPEKYLAVVSGVPSVLHPGACLLAVSKQSPPVFALYWDKKPQFSFEGRTALWDSVLLLCHKIKTDYGGIVRGMHLGSSALGILPVLDEENSE